VFGYIRPVKNEFDNYLFKAQYCCLCKALGRQYGFSSRMFLSFDITFFALLLHALGKNEFIYRYEPCIMHPVEKRRVKTPNQIDFLSADISVFLAKKKIEDNIKDEKNLKRLFYQSLCYVPFNWNRKKLNDYNILNKLFDDFDTQEMLKKMNSDELSNEFGKILEQVILYASKRTNTLIPNQTIHFAFLIGKLIYLLDAFEDLEQDLKSWKYNPLIFENKDIILSYPKKVEAALCIRKEEKWRLYLLLDHIQYSFSFLREFLGIYLKEIDGIITKSLPAMIDRVIKDETNQIEKGDLHESRSL